MQLAQVVTSCVQTLLSMDTMYLYLNCGCVGDIPMTSFLSDRIGRCDVQVAETKGVRGLPNENGECQYGVQAQCKPRSQAALVSTSTEYKPWASLIPSSPGEHQCGV